MQTEQTVTGLTVDELELKSSGFFCAVDRLFFTVWGVTIQDQMQVPHQYYGSVTLPLLSCYRVPHTGLMVKQLFVPADC